MSKNIPRITKEEFEMRIANIRKKMLGDNLDAMLVYGDEYRKENLRYVSNFWPIFERGALLIPKVGEPFLLCAPEGEKLAEEMSVWDDIRLLSSFLCVTVPDAIDYPNAKYTSFSDIAGELRQRSELKRLGIAGMDAMNSSILDSIKSGFNVEVVDANDILFTLRKTKSENELGCLSRAAAIADEAFEAMMCSELIGKTELQAVAIAEGKARELGAEQIIFTVFGSGERSHTIVGRPTEKIIEDGDMIMCALAVQYQGYVSTCEAPFAVGNVSADTQRVIDILLKASAAGVSKLRAGVPMKEFVKAVKQVYRDEGVEEFDIYPPLHGIGCAEAEMPYPDENTEALFEVGMTVNTDISLFGMQGGSNRIEEGFMIAKDGAQTLSPFVRKYCETRLKEL